MTKNHFNSARYILIAMSLIIGISARSLTGAWRGDLNLGQIKLGLVFNFTEGTDGKTTCTLDVPAQGAKDVPALVDFCDTDSVAISIKLINGSFRGKIKANEINGTFSQRGYNFPLTLTPEKDISVRRPQTPCPPFPYTQIDTTFTSFDGTLLSGTLVIPLTTSSAKIPAVVMVTGSGPQNRDEELFEHRPFAVIADQLARNGIASFRYDDRGTAKSKGDFATSTSETFKKDAGSALNFLKSVSCIGKTGVLGHSEGGTIALKLASENKPDFVISLAGMAVSGKDCILLQNKRALDKTDLSEQQKEESLRLIAAGFDHLIAHGSVSDFNVENYIKENNLNIPPQVLASLTTSIKRSNEWFRELLSTNPVEWLGKIKKPVLAVNGTLDTQVESESNLDIIRKHVRNAEVKSYPGLNHLLQHATTGEVSEYGDITETISPEVLTDITLFIKNQHNN